MADRNYRIHPDAKVVDVDLDQEEIYFRGERLTEERAEQIAEEALAAARAKNLIPGGKSLSGKGDHSPAIPMYECLRSYIASCPSARAAGVSASPSWSVAT